MAGIKDFLTEHDSILATVACGLVLLAFIYTLTRNRRLLRELLSSREVAAEDRRNAQTLAVDLKDNIRSLKDESRDLADLSFKLPSLMRQLTVDLERRSQGPLILRVLEEIFSPSQALVFFADDGQDALTLVAGSGLKATGLSEGSQIAVGDGHVGFAARKQVVMDAHDFRLESNLEREQISRTSQPGVKADLCAPLMSNGRLLGAICMGIPRKWASVEIKRLFGMVADVGALAISSHLQYREIRQLANSDPLTRIANKGYFMERAAQIIEDVRGGGSETGILMIDVDYFKKFNDTYGHLAGDRVLRGIGTILKQHVREGDIAARFGGEEFIVLLRSADGETAERVAERIRVAIGSCDFEGLITDPSQSVTASAGVAVFPDDGTQLGDLIGKADQALYEAKEHGRDRVRRYGVTVEVEEKGELLVEDSTVAAPVESPVERPVERTLERDNVARTPREEPEEGGALDILSALQGALPLGLSNHVEEECEVEEEEGPPPLPGTILDMTREVSEAS